MIEIVLYTVAVIGVTYLVIFAAVELAYWLRKD